ncbi:unnamed protein product (macronuclear) [Paramecium tetraurelia]|uniref:Uncharacterized protein n=1 Tax=Paramecium tetraurelia TaxID=5888 RepID=A0DIH6_PARTE|nr:uncharacterized protein GSPATT00017215001 [Paramecium tetraurelia]CAK82843.1 unnamed protein product [Paramecium tetraurelia]|eukprot:XP_001450240.1 hypothetical protein (macronuclear) [Paramecium tetraurelia strain d4-2]
MEYQNREKISKISQSQQLYKFNMLFSWCHISIWQQRQFDSFMGCQDRNIKIQINWSLLVKFSVLFSPDGTTSTFGSQDSSISKLDDHMSIQSAFLLMVLHWHLVAMTNLSVYGILKQDNKDKRDGHIEYFRSVWFSLVVMINLTLYRE